MDIVVLEKGKTMDKKQKELAKVIEKYFGADAAYLDIDCFTLARRIMEAGWTKPVRCKECQWWKRKGLCPMYGLPEDSYCFYGERSNDE